MKIRKRLAAILCLILPLNILACTPVKVHSVFFKPNSSQLSISEFQRLNEWTNWLKKTYPIRESIGTEARVETTEKDRIQLGWQRELAVRLALIDLDFTAPDFDPTGEVLIEPPRAPTPGGGVPSRSVYINFIPDCPHECPCQVHVGSRKD